MTGLEELAAVDITAWEPRARRIPVGELDPRLHRVFDTYGGTHALSLVRSHPRWGVTIVREDGVTSTHPNGSTITVVDR